MTIIISPPRDSKDLAAFLEKVNADPTRHIGYCGDDKEEIYHTLCHDFSDLELSQSFAVAYKQEDIVGAIGLDIDKEDRSAEVWGPFISNETDWSIADNLLKKVISYSSIQLKNINFFLNKDNVNGRSFVLNHSGVEESQHAVLEVKRKDFGKVTIEGIEKYNPTYKESFSNLHEDSFPNTFYNALAILSRLNEVNQVFVATHKNQEIKGYVYVEAEPQHQTGSIEYITVSNQFRQQGIGTNLIKYALVYLFSYDGMEKISLCVGSENVGAIQLYKAAGFQVKHELNHYQLELSSMEVKLC